MELDELRLPSNNDLWVKLRRKILWGDELAVEAAVVGTLRQSPLQSLAAFKRQRVFQLIESWSLHQTAAGEVGITGVPLPMTPESLALLEPADGAFLYAYAEHRFEVREDVENPFVPGSPSSSSNAGVRPRSSRKKSS